jgi:hypothetical protein
MSEFDKLLPISICCDLCAFMFDSPLIHDYELLKHCTTTKKYSILTLVNHAGNLINGSVVEA